jgi:hypothetical protein
MYQAGKIWSKSWVCYTVAKPSYDSLMKSNISESLLPVLLHDARVNYGLYILTFQKLVTK